MDVYTGHEVVVHLLPGAVVTSGGGLRPTYYELCGTGYSNKKTRGDVVCIRSRDRTSRT